MIVTRVGLEKLAIKNWRLSGDHRGRPYIPSERRPESWPAERSHGNRPMIAFCCWRAAAVAGRVCDDG